MQPDTTSDCPAARRFGTGWISPKTSVSPWAEGYCDIGERVHSITLLTLVVRS
jgi:hypothetical protein